MTPRQLRPWTDLGKRHPDVEDDKLTETGFAIDPRAIAAGESRLSGRPKPEREPR